MNFSVRGAVSRLLFTILLLCVAGSSDAAIRVASPDCLYTGDPTCGDGIDQELKGSDTKTPPAASFSNLDPGKYSANAKDGYYTSPFVKTADTSSSSGTIVEKAGVYSRGRGGGPFSVTTGTYFLWAKVLVPETALLRDRFICVDTSPIPETIDTDTCAFLGATFDPESPPSFAWQKVGALADFGNATNGTAHVSFALSGAGAFYFTWHEKVKVDCFYISTNSGDTPVCPSGTPSTGITHNATGTAATGSSVSSLAPTITVAAGTDKVILAGVCHRTGTNTITGVSSDVNGAFTLVGWANNGTVATAIYRLVNPTAGAHTVTVSFSEAQNAAAGLTAYNGVNQTSPVSLASTFSGTGQPSYSVASGIDFLAVDQVCASTDTAQTLTADGNQTQRWQEDIGLSGGANRKTAHSTKQGDSSVTFSWTLSEADRGWSAVATSLRDTEAGGTPPTVTNQKTTLVGNTSATVEAEVDQAVDCRADSDIDSGTPYANSNSTTSTGNKCIHSLTGLTAGTPYFYRICANNGVDAEVCHAEGTFTTSSFVTQLWTQAEIDIFVARATDGPYRSKGDVSTNSPGEWLDRIIPHSDNVGSGTVWAGQTNNSAWYDADPIPVPHGDAGQRMSSAGLRYLATGNTTMRDTIRTQLLSQIGQTGTDFANDRTRWPHGRWNPLVLQLGTWLKGIVFAYDAIRSTLTAGERADIDAWFLGAARHFDAGIHGLVIARYPNRDSDDYVTEGPDGPSSSDPGPVLYFGGPVSNGPFRQAWVNIPANVSNTIAMISFVIDDPGTTVRSGSITLRQSCKRYFEELFKFVVYPQDGQNHIVDMSRWVDTMPTLGWGYSAGHVGLLILTADLFARHGDTSLYEFSTSDGEDRFPFANSSTKGGPKSLRGLTTTIAKYVDGSLVNYGTNQSSRNGNPDYQIRPFDVIEGGHRIRDKYIAKGNIFWRDSYLKSIYTRTASGAPAYPSNPPENNGRVDSPISAWLFMHAQLENVVWPYSGVDP